MLARHAGWLLVFAVAACGGSDSAGGSGDGETEALPEGDPGLPGPGWTQRRKITIDDSVLGMGLTDVPVLVKVDPSRIYYDSVESEAAVRFYDGALQTELVHEVERWSGQGTSYFWVRLPVIDDSEAGRAFWMYTGKEGLPEVSAADVWSHDFVAVWHMEAPGGRVVDSTGRGNDGALEGGGAQVGVTGHLGSALAISASGSYLEVPEAPSLFPGQAMTLEGWVSPSRVDGTAARAVIRKRESFALFGIGDMTGDPGTPQGILWFATAMDRAVTGDSPLTRDSWTYVAMTFDAATADFSLWVDGTRAVTREPPPEMVLASEHAMEIGLEAYGFVDEVRISAVARDDAWMQVQAMSAADELLTFGDAQVPPG